MPCSELHQLPRASSKSFFDANLAVLREFHPELAAQLDAFKVRDQVKVLQAKDGAVCYAFEQDGRLAPITDPVSPIARLQKQLNEYAQHLADFTRPVLVIGLYPGIEVLRLFDACEAVTTPHCPQPLWLCLDSTICLYGFFCVHDARQLIASPRVRWFWHEEMPAQVNWLREHPEFPHTFTLISGAPDRVLDEILPPLAALCEERAGETERRKTENEQYYTRVNDQELAQVLAGRAGRKPRILMPTCTWSTFIQHSTRDTCAAFERLGWETRTLNMDAMLTPYHLVRQINEFRPDVFLFIDHMRHEAEEVYPRNMMFVTWIQDDMSNLQCKKAGEKLGEYAARGKRDLVVGYVEGLETKYSFPKDRLVPLLIPADPRIFHPVTLTDADRAKYGCDLAFMTNTSMSSEQVIAQKILPQVEPLGISRAICMQIHDDLWKLYRSGDTLIDRTKFAEWLMRYPEFAAAWNVLHAQDEILRLFYWRLNDTIYRHVVLEWADELGTDLRLYGRGWEEHPRFAKYARGPLNHSSELNTAYQCARWNLHLNITQGMHQRLWEIIAAGAQPLVRAPARPSWESAELEVALRHLTANIREFGEASPVAFQLDDSYSSAQREALQNFIFKIAWAQTNGEFASPIEERVGQILTRLVGERLDCQIPDWNSRHFTNRESFAGIIRRKTA